VKRAADRPPLVVVGGSTNALSVARSLGELGVRVYGLGVDPFVARSRHLEPIRLGPDADSAADVEAAWTQALLGPATEHLRGAVVVAGDDVGLTVLARHRDALLERFRLDESDVRAQLGMLDKLTTYEWAREAGVPTPRFWRVATMADLERLRDELVYPLIVKPLLSHEYQARFPGATKFRVAEDHDALVTGYRELAEVGLAVMLVEKILGSDEQLCSYATHLDASGVPAFDFHKRVIRRYPPNEGLACYHVTGHDPEVKELALRLLKHAGVRGLASVEFIRDERDGLLKLIECNARFSAANPLLVVAGIDAARLVYFRAIGEAYPLPAEHREGLRLWYPVDDLRSFLALRRRGELGTGRWLRSIAHRQHFPILALRDPMPAVARAVLRARKALRQR
jgi:D-aspartate ligase